MVDDIWTCGDSFGAMFIADCAFVGPKTTRFPGKVGSERADAKG